MATTTSGPALAGAAPAPFEFSVVQAAVAGSTVPISGTGCPATTAMPPAVDVFVGTSTSPSSVAAVTAYPDGDGSWSTIFAVPAGTPAGRYQVFVVCLTELNQPGRNYPVADFSVDDGGTPQVPPPANIDLPEGRPGATRVVRGADCRFGGQAGTAVVRAGIDDTDPTFRAAAAADGSWRLTVTVPDTPPGAFVFRSFCEPPTGVAGAFEYQNIAFRVLPTATVAARVVAEDGRRLVEVTGGGCLVGGDGGGVVNAVLADSDGRSVASGGVRAAIDGTWSLALEVPLAAPAGSYRATATCTRPEAPGDVIADYGTVAVDLTDTATKAETASPGTPATPAPASPVRGAPTFTG